jgi:hypothetical protein
MTLLKFCVVLLLTLVISNQPPDRSEAADLKKTVVSQAEVKPVDPVTQPQPAAPAPAVEPQPVTHPVGCEHYRQLLADHGLPVELFMRIAFAESGCNPYAIGDTWAINGLYAPSCGLFQIRTLEGRPSCEELHDPATNIAWAKRIYLSQGLSAWSVCTNGKASCY